MMTGRRELSEFVARGLAALALTLALGHSAVGAKADPRLAANPALSRIAKADPAAAQRLLGDIEQALQRPAPPPMRGGFGLDAEDESLLADNPLLKAVYIHDPVAALELLKRVKDASPRQR